MECWCPIKSDLNCGQSHGTWYLHSCLIERAARFKRRTKACGSLADMKGGIKQLILQEKVLGIFMHGLG